MNEIKRMQFLAGLNEIKVNNPINVFHVTDLGREMVENFVALEKLAEKFGVNELLKDEGPEQEIFAQTQLLYIFSDTYGEGIIKMKEINRLEDYESKCSKIWDEITENNLYQLETFKKLNFIK